MMMKGEGFIPLVSVGDKVTCGQPLIAFDLNLVASKAPSLNTMITIINGDEFVLGARSQGMAHAGVTALFSVSQVLSFTIGLSKLSIFQAVGKASLPNFSNSDLNT